MKNNQMWQTLGMSLLAGVALSVSQAEAATMTYTAIGGLISGTINGTPFANAAWSITATGDTGDIQVGSYPAGSSSLPYSYVPVNPVLTIDDGITVPWMMALSDSIPATWHVMSFDYQAFAGSLYTAIGFFLFDGVGIEDSAGILGPFEAPNLATEAFLNSDESGFFDAPISTSMGELVVTVDSYGPGTFTITAVPETSTVIPTMTLIAGGLLLRRRSGRRFGGR